MIDLSRFCHELMKKHSRLLKSCHTMIGALFTLLRHPSEQTKALLPSSSCWGDFPVASSGNRIGKLSELWSAYGLEKAAHPEKDLPRLLFSIQTFYLILVKLLLTEQLSLSDITDSSLLTGSFLQKSGLKNLTCPKAYSWLLYEDDCPKILAEIKKLLLPFRCENGITVSNHKRSTDYFKLLYETILPPELRHALGEYYTPDYLAEATLQRALTFSSKETAALKVLDPCCGSGTFLVQAIDQKRQAGADLSTILKTVQGIDLQPLAVFTAKVNYLLAVYDLWDKKTPLTFPVYEGDLLSPLLPADETESGDCIRSLAGFDLVIGNPPWMNGEYLPKSYRQRIQTLWQQYGFFQTKGTSRSFLKEDLSQLLTYAAMDLYLAKGGILAFLLPQSIFKSQQNGASFRRFRLPDGTPMKVLHVEDLSTIRIFSKAMTSASCFFALKGETTSYPVPYLIWRKETKPRGFPKTIPLRDVLRQVTIHPCIASPSDGGSLTSPWMTGAAGEVSSLHPYLGTNPYSARTGIFTGGANSVYWVTIHAADSQLVTVTNVTEGARRKAPSVTCQLEPTFFYPMVKGKNIEPWKVTYDTYLLCPHTAETRLYPVSEEELSAVAPKTLRYLKSFAPLLRERRGFSGWEREIQQEHFHAILRVGDYTFSPYKVVWRYIAKRFICAVISRVNDPYLGKKLLLPNEKVMYLSTDSPEEAYYLCGILSSSPVSACIESYMAPTCISSHVLTKLKIPPFQKENPIHQQISTLCREGHAAGEITPYLRLIDRLVLSLYRP